MFYFTKKIYLFFIDKIILTQDIFTDNVTFKSIYFLILKQPFFSGQRKES